MGGAPFWSYQTPRTIYIAQSREVLQGKDTAENKGPGSAPRGTRRFNNAWYFDDNTKPSQRITDSQEQEMVYITIIQLVKHSIMRH